MSAEMALIPSLFDANEAVFGKLATTVFIGTNESEHFSGARGALRLIYSKHAVRTCLSR